jgi:Fe-S-cluster containining protein
MPSIEFQLNECYRFIQSNFKCERCGRCCICINPIVITQREAQMISKKKKKPVSEFVNGLSIKKEKYEPCPFLEGKDCSIYNLRPTSCKTYPFLQIAKHSKEISLNYHRVIIGGVPPKCPAMLKVLSLFEKNFGAKVMFSMEEVQLKEILRENPDILVLVALENNECTKRLENMQKATENQ